MHDFFMRSVPHSPIIGGPFGQSISKTTIPRHQAEMVAEHVARRDVARLPKNFEENYRAENWRYHDYRMQGLGEPSEYTVAEERTMWMERTFPRIGRPDTQEKSTFEWVAELISRENRDQPEGEMRARMDEARTWFESQGSFAWVKPLGFGGLGLTMHFKYTGNPEKDVVLKVALEGWEATDVRNEARSTRQMNRAAHCIQMIDPADIGMQTKPEFNFDSPDSADSSDEKSSSGEESREDTAPRVSTRRWKMEHDLPAMEAKWARQTARNVKRRADIKTRIRMKRQLFEAKQRGKKVDIDPVHWRADNKDYLLLEYMPLGDLQNMLVKLAEQGDVVPNRVLWSFWLCLVRACIALE
ncbi:hypothetical protein M426DRAFT_23704 [Hypoxylon sp. CI-4A]|nr:hypothetical protein M426DRAFT_23704 [Hypoxylon sp. CI-4A]